MRRPIRDRLRGQTIRSTKNKATKYHVPHMHTIHIEIRVGDNRPAGETKFHVWDDYDAVWSRDAVLPEDGLEVDVFHLHGAYRPQFMGYFGNPTVELAPTGPGGEILYYIVGKEEDGAVVRILADKVGAEDMGFGRWV